jgi:hypothetical protein
MRSLRKILVAAHVDSCTKFVEVCRAAKRVKSPETGGGPKSSKGQSSSRPNYKSSGPVKEGYRVPMQLCSTTRSKPWVYHNFMGFMMVRLLRLERVLLVQVCV